jgi:pimeloyl-ACP methyl ester carboxylesterase
LLTYHATKREKLQVALVEDHGSPITVFSFSGAAERIGRIPAFEFRSSLRKAGADYNLVFFRDIHSSFYHATPEGSPGGLDFFAGQVNALIESLSASHNVAIGCSMGGSAAIYFAARCRLDQVVAFSPIFPLPGYDSAWIWLQELSKLSILLRSPVSYLRSIISQFILHLLYKRGTRYTGGEHLCSFDDPYKCNENAPDVTIYYAERFVTDTRHAHVLSGYPVVRCVALRTADHVTPRYLKKRGRLVSSITEPIEAALARKMDSEN